MTHGRALRALLAVACVAALSCDAAPPGGGASEDLAESAFAEPPRSLSPTARVHVYENRRRDIEAKRHPSDGGGRAWLVDPPEGLVAGRSARFEIVYEAGPPGIARGGAVFFQGAIFGGWDDIQIDDPGAGGYTRAETDAPGVELRLESWGVHLLAIRIGGRRLEPGERIRIFYGDGDAGARVDRWAERDAPLWLAVDGDGDSVRAPLRESPRVDVAAAAPRRLLLTLPTTARPGDPIRLTVALLDGDANAGFPFEGRVVLDALPAGLELPGEISFEAHHRGRRHVEGRVLEEGIYRLRARAGPDLASESNPLVVRRGVPRLLWGDLHGHSGVSDGTGTPEAYFEYARDVAGLDVSALTDHDHLGVRYLDQTPELWQRIQDATRAFHEPGRFVTIPGYEWTSWLHGHRHVLTFAGEPELLSWIDPRYETPAQLWAALGDRPVLTFAHHSAGGPIATNWDFLPDPRLEPVTEIVSIHGSSEAADSPGRVYDAVDGNYVRDVLDRGVRFGFIGSGDSHNGHPGFSHLTPGSGMGGLAAILTEDATRAGVLAALRTRRVYATSGPRIWLDVTLADEPMGSTLAAAAEGAGDTQDLRFEAITPLPIARIDIVRSGRIVASVPGRGRREWTGHSAIARLERGEYVYLRLVQENGAAAWSSPVYAD